MKKKLLVQCTCTYIRKTHLKNIPAWRSFVPPSHSRLWESIQGFVNWRAAGSFTLSREAKGRWVGQRQRPLFFCVLVRLSLSLMMTLSLSPLYSISRHHASHELAPKTLQSKLQSLQSVERNVESFESFEKDTLGQKSQVCFCCDFLLSDWSIGTRGKIQTT